MFESIKQDGRLSGVVCATALLVSLMVHAAVVCLLVVVPLLFFDVLQAGELVTFLIEPPAPPAPLPPPSLPVRAASGASRHDHVNLDLVPQTMPKGIPPPDDSFIETFDPGLVVGEIPGGPAGVRGGTGKALEGILAIDNPPLPPPPPPPEKPFVRVGRLEPSKLLNRVDPVYPALAVKARASGTVVLEAFIDEEGNVSGIKVLSGHMLLVDAAVDAVRQWKYSPTVLNGEATPIVAVVTVYSGSIRATPVRVGLQTL